MTDSLLSTGPNASPRESKMSQSPEPKLSAQQLELVGYAMAMPLEEARFLLGVLCVRYAEDVHGEFWKTLAETRRFFAIERSYADLPAARPITVGVGLKS